VLSLKSYFNPWGQTKKRHYWGICALYVAVGFFIFFLQSHLHPSVVVGGLTASSLLLFLHTLRRLHDAGHSRWWMLLTLFPISISVDIAQLNIGLFSLNFLNVGDLIRWSPVFVGLFLPSKVTARVDSSHSQSYSHA
jgi:uncharacterized membrane protein YhaH (DUF805 family)